MCTKVLLKDIFKKVSGIDIILFFTDRYQFQCMFWVLMPKEKSTAKIHTLGKLITIPEL